MYAIIICGNGLRNWESDDSPWIEHARWYPECTFLIVMKRKEFIDQVQQERPPFETHTSPTHINEDQLDKLIKELDSIEAVISMGFPKNHVMTTFHNQLKEKGIPFFNLESCIEAVLSQMENETRKALNLASNREIEVEVKVSTSSQHVALTEVDVVPSPSIFGDITAKTELASNQKIEEEVQTLSLQHVGLTEVDVVPSPITTQTKLASNQEEIEEEVQTLSPHHVALTKVDVVPSPPTSDDITTQTELASNQEIEEEVQNLSPPQAEAVILIQAIDELKPPMSITQMVPVLKPPVSVGSSGGGERASEEEVKGARVVVDLAAGKGGSVGGGGGEEGGGGTEGGVTSEELTQEVRSRVVVPQQPSSISLTIIQESNRTTFSASGTGGL
ncbi:baculoviral IAP repeat-containing protein 3-like [Procambarus clarkii]|uniref:baculoviral IAP repeat-containing protein 3-like n=1 Tax=Procambarus clarkii TaxID=6728 RepID=UPI003742A615